MEVDPEFLKRLLVTLEHSRVFVGNRMAMNKTGLAVYDQDIGALRMLLQAQSKVQTTAVVMTSADDSTRPLQPIKPEKPIESLRPMRPVRSEPVLTHVQTKKVQLTLTDHFFIGLGRTLGKLMS